MKSAHLQVVKYVLENICLLEHIAALKCVVDLHDEFVPEYALLEEEVRVEFIAHINLLREYGPGLGRPCVDTLSNSKYANMKELRFNSSGGVWRFAFAFDPKRHAIIFCGGDKSGVNKKVFYKDLIEKADRRFDAHIQSIEKASKPAQNKKRKVT